MTTSSLKAAALRRIAAEKRQSGTIKPVMLRHVDIRLEKLRPMGHRITMLLEILHATSPDSEWRQLNGFEGAVYFLRLLQKSVIERIDSRKDEQRDKEQPR